MSQYDSLPFVWTADVFGTNHAEMDEEHRGELEHYSWMTWSLVNTGLVAYVWTRPPTGLFTGIDKLDRERTAASFEELAGLVIKHFQDEEAAASLPEGHLKAHKDLLEVATATLGKLQSGEASVDDGLVDYLRKWLMNHIKASDIPAYGK